MKRTYIEINGTRLPISRADTYEIEISDYAVEGTTEAGTHVRDVVREGIVRINISLKVTSEWLGRLREFKALPRLSVRYVDLYTGELSGIHTMYMAEFRPGRALDTGSRLLWTCSCSLEDLDDV